MKLLYHFLLIGWLLSGNYCFAACAEKSDDGSKKLSAVDNHTPLLAYKKQKIALLQLRKVQNRGDRFKNKEKTHQSIIDSYVSEVSVLLKQGSLAEFDALVGDASCQLRALVIPLLYGKLLRNQALDADEQQFLIISRILSKFKRTVFEADGITLKYQKISYEKLLEEHPSLQSSKLALRFVKKLQATLAQLSVQYIQKLADLIADNELKKALQYTNIDNAAFSRVHCAAFPSLKAVLEADWLMASHY